MLILSVLGAIAHAEGGIAKGLVDEIEPALEYDVNFTTGQTRVLTEMLLDYARYAKEERRPRWERFKIAMDALNFIEIHGEKRQPLKIPR